MLYLGLDGLRNRSRIWCGCSNWSADRIRRHFFYDARRQSSGFLILHFTEDTLGIQVNEKRTPLQIQMDELAKKLSILSFIVIGVICIIGVLQQRAWLDMFTIGGVS